MLLCILVTIMGMSGCGNKKSQSEYEISYVNIEGTNIYKVSYDTDTTDTDGLVDEFLGLLSQDPGEIDYKNAIPSDVDLNSYSRSDDELTVDFSKEYLEMDTATEVLCRAALVQTLIQIKDISYVAITVEDVPLTDHNGKVIGFMNAEDFTYDPGAQINLYKQTSVDLYYADHQGKGLVKETDTVYKSSDTAVERLIVEQLMKEPKTKGLQSAIPSAAKLLGVSVMDGICVVNFDSGFLKQDYDISEGVVIYSIVNSLTELSTVSKVQITVDGESKGVYRKKFSLSNLYERNLDYVHEVGKTTTN